MTPSYGFKKRHSRVERSSESTEHRAEVDAAGDRAELSDWSSFACRSLRRRGDDEIFERLDVVGIDRRSDRS